MLNRKKRGKLWFMLYRHKELFSLRDEIGICPNIEVGIDVMDNISIFH